MSTEAMSAAEWFRREAREATDTPGNAALYEQAADAMEREPMLMAVVEAARAYHALMESAEIRGMLLVAAAHGAGSCSEAEAERGEHIRERMHDALRALDEGKR